MYKFGEYPALTLMSILQMPLDNGCAVVVYVLNTEFWKVYERDVVQKPLWIIEMRNIAFVVKE